MKEQKNRFKPEVVCSSPNRPPFNLEKIFESNRIKVIQGEQEAKTRRWVFTPAKNKLIPIAGREEHFEQITSRDLLTSKEKITWGNARILFAGGSTGGDAAVNIAHEGGGVLKEGKLVIADFDKLDVSNIGRLEHNIGDLGEDKVELTAQKIQMIFPEANIEIIASGITTENMASLVSDVDYVVEATDGWAKFGLRVIARKLGKDLIMGTNLESFWPIIDVEKYSAGDRPLFHGRLEPIFGRIDENFLEAMNKNQELQKQAFGMLLLLGVGIENLNQKLLDHLLAYMVGKKESFPQMRSSVSMTSGAITQTLKNLVLDQKVEPRTIIGPQNPSPAFCQQRIEYLNYAQAIASQLPLPKKAKGLITKNINQQLTVYGKLLNC